MDKKVEKNGYAYSKQWFEFAFENPEKVSPVHGALYFWLIQLNNRLDWKDKFGVPTYDSMEAIGVRNYRTYKKAFDDLKDWGFIHLIEKAKNQHTANIIEMVKFTKASPELEDLRLQILPKQVQSTATIDKQEETNPNFKEEGADKSALPNKDFIDLVIAEFRIVFKDYVMTPKTLGKEKKDAGVFLALWKIDNVGLSSGEALTTLHQFFEKCKNIDDHWHRNKMSLGHMASKYNEIKRILASTPKQKGIKPFRQDEMKYGIKP